MSNTACRPVRLFYRLLTATILLCAAGCAPAAEVPLLLRVVATDPGTEAILGAQQRFHVKFAITGKTPLVVTLEPYFEGQPLSANLGTSAPVTLPAGGGSAVAYLFFWGDYATRVDEIRLTARAPKQTERRAELALPVKLSWVAREVPPREPAAWVNEPPSGGTIATAELDERSKWFVFGAVLVAIAVAGFGSRWLRRRWRGNKSGV